VASSPNFCEEYFNVTYAYTPNVSIQAEMNQYELGTFQNYIP
jgi:hypothetical protein